MSGMVTILGAGESGEGAAKLCHQLGMPCRVTDSGSIDAERKARLETMGVVTEEGGHDKGLLTDSDLLIKSPGVPSKAAPIQWAQDAGVEVIGELEFASRHTNAKIAAITGTNGKTTTTGLLNHLLNQGGLDSGCAGNIGSSFAGAIADAQQRPEGDRDIWVVEASSFQLEDAVAFKPDVALLLNLTPDHLDRHGDVLPHRDPLQKHLRQLNIVVAKAVGPIVGMNPPVVFIFDSCGEAGVTMSIGALELRHLFRKAIAQRVVPRKIGGGLIGKHVLDLNLGKLGVECVERVLSGAPFAP